MTGFNASFRTKLLVSPGPVGGDLFWAGGSSNPFLSTTISASHETRCTLVCPRTKPRQRATNPGLVQVLQKQLQAFDAQLFSGGLPAVLRLLRRPLEHSYGCYQQAPTPRDFTGPAWGRALQRHRYCIRYAQVIHGARRLSLVPSELVRHRLVSKQPVYRVVKRAAYRASGPASTPPASG